MACWPVRTPASESLAKLAFGHGRAILMVLSDLGAREECRRATPLLVASGEPSWHAGIPGPRAHRSRPDPAGTLRGGGSWVTCSLPDRTEGYAIQQRSPELTALTRPSRGWLRLETSVPPHNATPRRHQPETLTENHPWRVDSVLTVHAILEFPPPLGPCDARSPRPGMGRTVDEQAARGSGYRSLREGKRALVRELPAGDLDTVALESRERLDGTNRPASARVLERCVDEGVVTQAPLHDYGSARDRERHPIRFDRVAAARAGGFRDDVARSWHRLS